LGLEEIVAPKTFAFAESSNEFILENGQKLGPITVVYETYGKLDRNASNAILLLHGMGVTAHAAGRYTPGGPLGWWDGLIGPEKPFDSAKYFIVSPQALAGGHRDNKPGSGTTGPHSIDPRTGKPYGMRFPVFTIRDMARVHMELLKHLGVKHLVFVSGISMGGYQALEFICTFPDFVEGAIPVVARGRSSAQHMANHLVRRMAIMNDPNWQNGDYYNTGRYPTVGMAIASITSASSYNNSPKWYENNLIPADPNKTPYDGFNNLFVLENDLMKSALASAEKGIDANCYLYQSRALSTMNLGWKRGDYSRGYRASLADGLRLVNAAVLMMPSRTDGSVRPEFATEIVDILRTMGKKAELHVIDSDRGHAGSSEYNQMIPAMKNFIKGLPGAR
jgi:homoserine O-acetyltransferase